MIPVTGDALFIGTGEHFDFSRLGIPHGFYETIKVLIITFGIVRPCLPAFPAGLFTFFKMIADGFGYIDAIHCFETLQQLMQI